jgi:hypothetical protein
VPTIQKPKTLGEMLAALSTQRKALGSTRVQAREAGNQAAVLIRNLYYRMTNDGSHDAKGIAVETLAARIDGHLAEIEKCLAGMDGIARQAAQDGQDFIAKNAKLARELNV